MYRLFKPLSSILKWGLYNHWMNGRQIISLFSGVWSGWLNKNSQPSEVGAQKWKLQSRHRRAHKATAQDLLSALPQQQQEEYSGEPRGQKTNQTPYLRSYSSGLKDSDERKKDVALHFYCWGRLSGRFQDWNAIHVNVMSVGQICT